MADNFQNMKAEKKRSRNVIIPVQTTELSIFDNAFALMKERFADEMRKIEEQMNKFSKDLLTLRGQNSTVQSGVSSLNKNNIITYPVTDLESLANSPLVQGEGESKALKLQFDVTQFDPSEISVNIQNDMLIVSASHEEKTENSLAFREYNREFCLPSGVDPDSVVSSLSRDGVLTVHVPFPKPKIESLVEEKISVRTMSPI